MQITLTVDEMRVAAHAGMARRLSAIEKGRHKVYGTAASGNYWEIDIEAAAAEMALAKALGAFWVGVGDPAADRRDGDVCGLQVRHTKRPDGSLILHDRDDDDHTFVLVTGAMPTFTIAGWIRAVDGKDKRFWRGRPSVPRPAFFVPQSALTPLASADAGPAAA